jgi:hypothetical protein
MTMTVLTRFGSTWRGGCGGAEPERLCGQDELALAELERLRPHHARVDGPAGAPRTTIMLPKPGPRAATAARASRRNGKASTTSTRFEITASTFPEIAGEQAHDDAEDHGDGHRESAGADGDAGAVDDAREDVATERVGAEGMLPAPALLPDGRQQTVAHRLPIGVARGQERRRRRAEDGQPDDGGADSEEPEPAQATHGPPRAGSAGRATSPRCR